MQSRGYGALQYSFLFHRLKAKQASFARGLSSAIALTRRSFSVQHPIFPARSWLFTKPGTIDKAVQYQPDILIIDLEDSVGVENKHSTRDKYADALRNRKILTEPHRLYFRINNDENLLADDVAQLTQPGLAGFILPKVESASFVRHVDDLVTQVEKTRSLRPGSIRFALLVETPASLFKMEEIARASTRTVALITGSGDLTATALCDDESDTLNAFFGTVVLAAKAAGIEPIWGVYTRLDDHAGFDIACRRMRQSGYVGSLCLSLTQVAQSNAIFTLDPTEIKWVEKVIAIGENSDRSVQLVRNSVQESREMIGPPHIYKAKQMLERHQYVAHRNAVERAPPDLLYPINVSSSLKKTIIRVGDIVPMPTKVTISDAWKSAWESSFGRIPSPWNSAPQPALPFHMLACLSIAFAVSSFSRHARVHLGLYDVFQWRSAVVGDTLHALLYPVDFERKIGRDGENYAIVRSIHWLINQKNEIVFQTMKKTMFAENSVDLVPLTSSPQVGPLKLLNSTESPYRKRITDAPIEHLLPRVGQPVLSAGQLFAHELTNVQGKSQTRALCNLMEITNPHHHNTVKFYPTDILVPGPFVASAIVGNAGADLGEVLCEEMMSCVHVNKVNLEDQLGTISCIDSVRFLSEHLEEIVVQHLGVKNVDVDHLCEVGVPRKFFDGTLQKPSDFEAICRRDCPLLVQKIACLMKRRFVRVRAGISQDLKRPIDLN